MSNRQIGTILSLSPNGDYGFIKFNQGDRIFFPTKQTVEDLKVNDTVLFQVGQSRKYPEKTEAYNVRKGYLQPNGFLMSLSPRLTTTQEAFDFLLNEMLNRVRIENDNKEQVVITQRYPSTIGVSLCIETSLDDEVFYATRKHRKGYYRFVKNREAEATNAFTMIINFMENEQFYELAACYFGIKTPPAPWDRHATPDAVDFWRNHALIPHEIFSINYDDVKTFDPDFFKSFEELQQMNKMP